MTSPAIVSIEIAKDYLHFNAAHFTLFSQKEREDLHGHTFYVAVTVEAQVQPSGLAFDYNLMKQKLTALCNRLDEKVLLPERSPFLDIVENDEYLIAQFGKERIPFLPRDVLTLPVRNITVEELSHWFLQQLIHDDAIAALALRAVQLRVSSGPGQWASAIWTAA